MQCSEKPTGANKIAKTQGNRIRQGRPKGTSRLTAKLLKWEGDGGKGYQKNNLSRKCRGKRSHRDIGKSPLIKINAFPPEGGVKGREKGTLKTKRPGTEFWRESSQ